MDFDLDHIKSELTDTEAILSDCPEPEAFLELGPRLGTLAYELETLAIYADSLSVEDVDEILRRAKEVQDRLEARVETDVDPAEAKKFLFKELSRFHGVTARLAYLV